jgi:2-keto-4-pentenoate hydratase/2-oxohepta-3-ene-1,7-dioic acid hydratase in catechol pathway
VRIPRKAEKTDWEVEFTVVIASEARYLQSRENALACGGLPRLQRRLRA